MSYFENLKLYGDMDEYLISRPKKAEVLNNARTAGQAAILPDSNNRAMTIKEGSRTFLQSYDTLILCIDEEAREIVKLWSGYSVTTLKHINTFLNSFGISSFNKKEWCNFTGMKYKV